MESVERGVESEGFVLVRASLVVSVQQLPANPGLIMG